jgi:hypothetical protein
MKLIKADHDESRISSQSPAQGFSRGNWSLPGNCWQRNEATPFSGLLPRLLIHLKREILLNIVNGQWYEPKNQPALIIAPIMFRPTTYHTF